MPDAVAAMSGGGLRSTDSAATETNANSKPSYSTELK
jgi:hypothetical protein